MGLPKNSLTSSNPLLVNHQTTLKTLNTSYNNSKAKSWKQGKSSPHMMSRPSSHQCQYNQPSKLSNKGYNRTPPSHKGPTCQYPKSPPCWSSALPTPTSSSRVSIMNKYKVQLWDSPISPLIANIFMEEFEVKALQSFPNPPSLWLRFVDDTFVINKAEHSQDLLHHINNKDPYIQFTVEPTQQGSLPFLDTLVTIQPDNTFSTSVYRKPTHTEQYLHWDSNHHITAKQSVFNTLAHRAKQCLQPRKTWTKNYYTSRQPSTTASFLPGP